MFQILDFTKENVIAIKATDKIEKTDYDVLNPLLEKTEKEYPDVHLYIEIGDIKGITAEALFKDILTYFKHVRNLSKVAVVGNDESEKTWAKLADPFTKGEVKYFKVTEQDVAKAWIKKNE